MEQYEIAVLYHPDLEIDLEKASGKVEKIFTANGGKIVNTDQWGKRKLAYKIAGQDHAVYIFYTVELNPENVAKIDGELRISDEVIRYLITRPDLKAIAKAEAAKEQAKKRAADRSSDSSDEEKEG